MTGRFSRTRGSRQPETGRACPGRAWVATCLLGLLACGQPSQGSLLVLRDVALVDGTGAARVEHRTVVIRDGRIESIDAHDRPLPRGAEVLELAGRTVLPGFCDLHVHLPTDPWMQERILEQLLQYGVTTLLNPGARPGAGVEVRERLRRGELVGPRMLTSGRIVEGEPPLPDLADWCGLVTSVEEVRAEVRAQAAAGVDWVKFYAHVPPELLEVGVREAHALGLRTVLHAGATGWGRAAGSGVDMLVHAGWGTPMDEWVDLPDLDSATDEEWYRAYADAPGRPRFERLVEQLVEHEVTVVPTLVIMRASGLGFDPRRLPWFRTELAPDRDLPGWWGAGWRERHPQAGELEREEERLLESVYWPGVLHILRAYHERGVRLAVGTDVGNAWVTPGLAFHLELELYQEAGIPPLEVLRIATRSGARALGLEHELGTLAAGLRADLVVLREDPSVDVRASRTIELVIQDGRVVHRAP